MMQSKLERRVAAPETASGDGRLVEAWRHEFMHVAMMTAFVSMGCNALGGEIREDRLSAIEANVPEKPAIYRAIRQGLLEVQPEHCAAMFAAQTAYDDMTAAMDALKNVRAQTSGRLSVAASGAPHIQLAQAWQAACRSFFNAVEIFEHTGLLSMTQASSLSLKTQCPLRLKQLLRAACAGETLLSGGGQPAACETSADAATSALPDWVQRRRWDRRHFNMKCSVAVKGQDISATIRNISLGGALIDNMAAVPRGTPVVVTTCEGRRLHASVMWAREGSLGVKFDEQLLYNDPLIETAGG